MVMTGEEGLWKDFGGWLFPRFLCFSPGPRSTTESNTLNSATRAGGGCTGGIGSASGGAQADESRSADESSAIAVASLSAQPPFSVQHAQLTSALITAKRSDAAMTCF